MKIEQTGQFRYEITFDREDEQRELVEKYDTPADIKMAMETWIVNGMAGD